MSLAPPLNPSFTGWDTPVPQPNDARPVAQPTVESLHALAAETLVGLGRGGVYPCHALGGLPLDPCRGTQDQPSELRQDSSRNDQNTSGLDSGRDTRWLDICVWAWGKGIFLVR